MDSEFTIYWINFSQNIDIVKSSISEGAAKLHSNEIGDTYSLIGYDTKLFTAETAKVDFQSSYLKSLIADARLWPSAEQAIFRTAFFTKFAIKADAANNLSTKEKLLLLLKASEPLVKDEDAVAIHFAPSATLMAASQFAEMAAQPPGSMSHIALWVNILWRRLEGTQSVLAVTKGLDNFIDRELEVETGRHSAQEIAEYILNIANYLIENGDIFKPGETLGYTQSTGFSIKMSGSNYRLTPVTL